MNTGELVELGQQLRVDSVRAAAAAGSGHPTSSMSAADLMAVLLARHFHYDFDQPDHPGNDRFVLSKGHASPLMYAAFKAPAPSTTRNSSPSASSAAGSKAIPPPSGCPGSRRPPGRSARDSRSASASPWPGSGSTAPATGCG